MGRSVNYLDNAEVVLYFHFEESQDDCFFWDDMIANLTCEIKAKFPSYYPTDKWGGREERIILENSFCSIGISEYCGLVSLSVAPRENDYANYSESLAKHHANQIKGTLEKVLHDLGLKNLRKVGTFSNGEAVFELAK
jgi:hypothetical protein